MEILSHSGIYSFHTKQYLPISIDEAWQFFSNPANLQKLTPDALDFRITSKSLEPIHQGQIITYSIRIFPLFRSKWVTEITFVKDKAMFIDEQRFGPYKLWHHRHVFEEVDGGVLMHDYVHFKLPFSWIAPLAFKWYVRKKIIGIFSFRKSTLSKLFGASDEA